MTNQPVTPTSALSPSNGDHPVARRGPMRMHPDGRLVEYDPVDVSRLAVGLGKLAGARPWRVLRPVPAGPAGAWAYRLTDAEVHADGWVPVHVAVGDVCPGGADAS